MQAQSARPVKTFTIGFHSAATTRPRQARRWPNHLGTDHTELYVTPATGVCDVIPRLPDCLRRAVRRLVADPDLPRLGDGPPARHRGLSGDGGDEFFAGYNRYHWRRGFWRRLALHPRTAAGAVASELAPSRRSAGWTLVWLRARRPPRPALPGDKLHKLVACCARRRRQRSYRRLVSHVGAYRRKGWCRRDRKGPDRTQPMRDPDRRPACRTHDIPGPGHLPARRHPGQGRSRQHGGGAWRRANPLLDHRRRRMWRGGCPSG